MFTMMESLRGRQMFSVASPVSATLPHRLSRSILPPHRRGRVPETRHEQPQTLCGLCTGKHIATGSISV